MRSKKYSEALSSVDRSKFYTPGLAVEILRKISYTKFDPTVELHVKIKKTGLKKTVSLPFYLAKESYEIASDKTPTK
jgi:large subunit ribosomal protein L1